MITYFFSFFSFKRFYPTPFSSPPPLHQFNKWLSECDMKKPDSSRDAFFCFHFPVLFLKSSKKDNRNGKCIYLIWFVSLQFRVVILRAMRLRID